MKKLFTVLALGLLLQTGFAQHFVLDLEDSTVVGDPGTTLILAGYIHNISAQPLDLKMVRLENNLPNAQWTSSMCLGLCAAPFADSITTIDSQSNPLTVPVGDSILVEVIFQALDPNPGSADVRVKFATLDDSQVIIRNFYGTTTVTSVGNGDRAPVSDFQLFANFPNPFNNQTIIPVSIAQSGNLTLEIFDILGHKIYTQVQTVGAGVQNLRWDGVNTSGRGVSSGVYFYRVRVAGSNGIMQSAVRKLTLLR